jgi:AcrR family transcriptional regulator
MTTSAPRRPSKAEQRDATRARILDAAVSCLIELGHARTTTLVVQERAGVSRGALLHHFPTRADLLAETVAHLFALQLAERSNLQIRPGKRIEQAVRLLWAIMTSTLSIAIQELWTAARTDAELRAALVRHDELVMSEALHTCAYIFGPELAAQPGFEPTMRLLISSMRGVAQERVLHPSTSVRNDLALWGEVAGRMLCD